MGALRIHGASTAKVDLLAEWTDPVDDPGRAGARRAQLQARRSTSCRCRDCAKDTSRRPATPPRRVGYYDPENDQIAMVRSGDHAGSGRDRRAYFSRTPRRATSSATRSAIIVRYTAVATSRYREYFAPDGDLDFTRTSEPVLVDVPASARPLAPGIVYVVPTFGWQRQSDTNMKRSVRFGGGLRVYLSAAVVFVGRRRAARRGAVERRQRRAERRSRDKFKPFFTQWGMDPIWQTAALCGTPRRSATSPMLWRPTRRLARGGQRAHLRQRTRPRGRRRLRAAVRHGARAVVRRSDDRPGWRGPRYCPFVRLALVRYQPHALDDARISRVVLAAFAQLTPDRAATGHRRPASSAHAADRRQRRSAQRTCRPAGPAPERPARPTHVQVRVQKRPPAGGELGWQDAPAAEAGVTQLYEGQGLFQPDLGLWVGTVTFTAAPAPGAYRLLIEEFEYISANYAEGRGAPGRLIYAEIIEVDAAMVQG